MEVGGATHGASRLRAPLWRIFDSFQAKPQNVASHQTRSLQTQTLNAHTHQMECSPSGDAQDTGSAKWEQLAF